MLFTQKRRSISFALIQDVTPHDNYFSTLCSAVWEKKGSLVLLLTFCKVKVTVSNMTLVLIMRYRAAMKRLCLNAM